MKQPLFLCIEHRKRGCFCYVKVYKNEEKKISGKGAFDGTDVWLYSRVDA